MNGITRDAQEAKPTQDAPKAGNAATLQEDPSNPGRFVKAKKQNEAFLKHARWKESQRGQERPDPISVASILKWLVVGVVSALALGHFITGDVLYGYNGKWRNPRRWMPAKQRVYTPAELALYNGRDASRPVYLAVLGNVYDVTAGGDTYRSGGSYDFFAGKDASRAFTTGCFQTHLTHDLRGLSDAEVEVRVARPAESKTFPRSHLLARIPPAHRRSARGTASLQITQSTL